ncbi:hypothetical protein ACWD6R_28465 [Streptomyces sp. NPDC005151]
MAGFRRSTAAAAIAATLLLAGCAGAAGPGTPAASATASPTPTAKATPVREKTLGQVLGDLRHTAKDLGDYRVRPLSQPGQQAAKVPPCQAAGVILTREVPGRDELALFTSRLQSRGWKLDTTGEMDFLSSGKWDVMLFAGPVPKKFADQTGPNKGAFGVHVMGVCKKSS